MKYLLAFLVAGLALSFAIWLPDPVERRFESPDGVYRLEVGTTVPGRLARRFAGGPGDACMHPARVTLVSREGTALASLRMTDSCVIAERPVVWEAGSVSFSYGDTDLKSATWELPR